MGYFGFCIFNGQSQQYFYVYDWGTDNGYVSLCMDRKICKKKEGDKNVIPQKLLKDILHKFEFHSREKCLR